MSKYNAEVVDAVVGTYVASVEAGDSYDERNAVMETLAGEYEVSVNAIRGILVSEKVYVKKEEAKASGETAKTTKADVANAFRAVTGLELKSLDNMTKKDLDAFWAKFVEMSERVNVGDS